MNDLTTIFIWLIENPFLAFQLRMIVTGESNQRKVTHSKQFYLLFFFLLNKISCPCCCGDGLKKLFKMRQIQETNLLKIILPDTMKHSWYTLSVDHGS